MPNQKKEAVVVTPEWFEEGVLGFLNGHIFFTPFFPSLSFFYTGEKMSTKQRVDGEEKTMGRIREEKTMGKE
jgi:hypothetical protein